MSKSGTKRARAQQAARAAQQQRMQRERQRRRQRAAWVSAVAVTVLLVVGLTGAVLWQSNRPDQVTPPAAATADGAGLPVGDGPVTVEVYLDFLCPACASFDAVAQPVLDQYLAEGTVTVVYRPIAILDRNTTTAYSTRAAGAAACAAGSENLTAFVASLLENQPVGQQAGLSDDQIVALGTEAGVSDPDFGQCVSDGEYRGWATHSTNDAANRGVQSTPTVFVDGTRLSELSLPALRTAVETAANG